LTRACTWMRPTWGATYSPRTVSVNASESSHFAPRPEAADVARCRRRPIAG